MQSTLLPHTTVRSYSIRMEAGDEAISCLATFARAQRLRAAHFTGLGGFSEVVLGFFDCGDEAHLSLPMRGQSEVASLVGDITLVDGRLKVQPYVVMTRSDGSAWGGHLLEAYVHPKLEILLTASLPETGSHDAHAEPGMVVVSARQAPTQPKCAPGA